MSLLGFIPKVLKFFGLKISRQQKKKDSIIVSNSRYQIHVSAQRLIDKDRHRKSKK